ncbi:MAG: response regulator transcription factor [Gammaproteobacteria bacterium]|nr:response regulator transcription factor [Gammaproteobacteria bacterium]
MRIALVEDDQDQAKLMQLWLEAAGHQCTHFGASKPFLRALARESFDLMIMDWMLPDISGLEALKTIREQHEWRVPVLFITQKDDEENIVEALQAGADDYMTKPPKQMEMLARIQALGRRGGKTSDSETTRMQMDPYDIDTRTRQVLVNGESVALTQKEYELVVFLFRNNGRIVSRGHLLESVWGTNPDINTRTIDTHMSRIRNKLKINPENGWRLNSIYQHGYRLERLDS